MTTVINGDTGIDKVQDGSIGTVDIAAGAVTQAKLSTNVAGNGPAFLASRTSSHQSVTSGLSTKAQLNGETFDTASAFDSATNYRFTPQVAGYYQINGTIYVGAASGLTRVLSGLFINGGATVYYGTDCLAPSATGGASSVSAVIYLNGSTDYVELWGVAIGTTLTFLYPYTCMSGVLVRAA